MSFAEVTTLVPVATGRFNADVSPDWTIGGKPNGGYLLALLGRAATAAGPHPHVIAASAHYLHSPEPGPVTVDTTVLRAGRNTSQVRARMTQHGDSCVEALLTTSTLQASIPYWTGGLDRPDIADRAGCIRVPAVTPTGLPVPIMGHVDLRIDPDDTGFARGEPSGRGRLRGWLALLGDESIDAPTLLYAVDAFPPATFDVAVSGWVPTLELTVYVRALPAPGPLQIVHQARVIDAQKVDEVCFVWDTTGRLVAQGTQLAGIRLG